MTSRQRRIFKPDTKSIIHKRKIDHFNHVKIENFYSLKKIHIPCIYTYIYTHTDIYMLLSQQSHRVKKNYNMNNFKDLCKVCRELLKISNKNKKFIRIKTSKKKTGRMTSQKRIKDQIEQEL